MTSKVDQRLEAETTYAYDALNRLTEFNPPGEGATTYGYDNAGNRTEAGGTTYSYNALNLFTEASDGPVVWSEAPSAGLTRRLLASR